MKNISINSILEAFAEANEYDFEADKLTTKGEQYLHKNLLMKQVNREEMTLADFDYSAFTINDLNNIKNSFSRVDEGANKACGIHDELRRAIPSKIEMQYV